MSSINHDMIKLPSKVFTANTFYHFLWSAVSSSWRVNWVTCLTNEKRYGCAFFFYKTYRNFKCKGIIAFPFSVCLSAVIIFIYIYWNMVILVKRCTSVLNLRCFEALLGFTIRIDLAVKMLNWHFLLTWTKFYLLWVTIFANHLLSVNAISVNLNFLFKNSD